MCLATLRAFSEDPYGADTLSDPSPSWTHKHSRRGPYIRKYELIANFTQAQSKVPNFVDDSLTLIAFVCSLFSYD